MYAWYRMKYFSDTLKVRRADESGYKSLGELKSVNGEQTVFDYKPRAPVPQVPYGFTQQPGIGPNLFG